MQIRSVWILHDETLTSPPLTTFYEPLRLLLMQHSSPHFQSLQCQLSTLVCRLEEAEGECADFRGALGEATSSREELRGELGRIRGECAGLQAQLAEEKVGHCLA